MSKMTIPPPTFGGLDPNRDLAQGIDDGDHREQEVANEGDLHEPVLSVFPESPEVLDCVSLLAAVSYQPQASADNLSRVGGHSSGQSLHLRATCSTPI